jgi:hypothetical protein
VLPRLHVAIGPRDLGACVCNRGACAYVYSGGMCAGTCMSACTHGACAFVGRVCDVLVWGMCACACRVTVRQVCVACACMCVWGMCLCVRSRGLYVCEHVCARDCGACPCGACARAGILAKHACVCVRVSVLAGHACVARVGHVFVCVVVGPVRV